MWRSVRELQAAEQVGVARQQVGQRAGRKQPHRHLGPAAVLLQAAGQRQDRAGEVVLVPDSDSTRMVALS